jgi:hypothetical protein
LAAERPAPHGFAAPRFPADCTHAEVRVDDRERRAREAVQKAKRKLPDLFSAPGNRKFFRSHMEVQDVDWLVDAAREGDRDAVQILQKYARGARGAGMIVPKAFHEFVWEYFIDGPPKAKSGTSSKDTDLRYQSIALLVKIVSKDFGFPEYRNVEHRGEKSGPMSACLLVAEEFGLSERRVEEIWGERKARIGQ